MVVKKKISRLLNGLLRINTQIFKRGLIMCVALMVLFISHAALAANTVGKYQVVAGNDDKAYLVDTSTGAVWVLTYRTMATGREPIAIPYKFIKISPQSEQEFLLESLTGASMPPGEKP
jgi:hypothetical protein